MAELTSSTSLNTYHCLCAQLLLASTHKLSTLPRRGAPAQDQAIVVPIQPSSSSDYSSNMEDAQDDGRPSEAVSQQPEGSAASHTHSLLVSTISDRRPTVIRREDGFEKRSLLRCGRCRLVIGYKLDPEQYSVAADGNGTREPEIVYILPGALVGTDEMKKGELPSKEPWELLTS